MIAIGSDHCGYELKKKIEAYLDQRKNPIQGFGCDSDQYCQYPVYGHRVARAVANGRVRPRTAVLAARALTSAG